MNIPAFSIKNYQLTLMVFVALLILGISSFLTMPRSEDPPMNVPHIIVTAIFPGANPLDMESQVADPIEEAVSELEDIKEIKTTIRDGVAVISVEFEYGFDSDEKETEVQRQINNIKDDLPDNLYDLNVRKVTTSNVKIFQTALISESAPFHTLKSEAERLKKRIENLKGVRKITIEAYPEEEVRIALDPVKMSAMGISLEDIERAIQSSNANIPGGAIKMSNKLFNIKTSGMYEDLREIENTVVGAWQGNLVYLKNVASVFFDYEEERWRARFNGQRCIFLNVEMKPGHNIFDLAEPIRTRLNEVELKEGIRLEYVFDQSKGVQTRISGFLSNLIQGIALVGLIIFLILGYRSASIVMMAIPLSILIGLFSVDMLGIGLQQISIAGLVVALGLLVDNSIAIIENIERFIALGYSREEAAIKGTQQLIAPMASATLTTVFAFIPMIMMPDTTGAFIRGLPLTVMATLMASLLVATTLTPFVASRVLHDPRHHGVSTPTRAFRALTAFVEGPYRRLLRWAFGHRALTFAFVVLCLGGAIILFPMVGISFFPKAEKPQFRITVELPNGSNMEATDEVVRYVESVLESRPLVAYYASNIGHGNPMIYYNVPSRSYSNNFAEIFVVLKSFDPTEFRELLEDLRAEFRTYSGARIDVKEYVQGPPSEAPIAIKIFGDDITRLEAYAREVEHIVLKIPGTLNVHNPTSTQSTDLYFHINRDKAMMLGVPVHVIDKTIRSFVAGATVSKFRDKDANNYDIVMKYVPPSGDFKPDDFDKIQVKSMSGRFIPLKHLASMEFKAAPNQILHLDRDRNTTVLADFDEKNYTLDEVIAQIDAQLRQIEWKDGYAYLYKGDLANRNKSFGGMGIASALAMLLILGILVIQFKSFAQPLIIFSALPLAIIGSILALLLTGWNFSFTGFVGFTSLIGIAINNSIILVDFANELRKEGLQIVEAAQKAAEVRFIPILLTTLTTILGLLPLTLNGGSLWAPMGWVIIGGLMTSTFFVLLIVPILYQIFSR
ncbi:MAG: efflux RND transporter permease subunit [Bacteroidetes bacterium]|nr:MAG: efflux RND transporter permease subunit [Bacteroidota bacterium]